MTNQSPRRGATWAAAIWTFALGLPLAGCDRGGHPPLFPDPVPATGPSTAAARHVVRGRVLGQNGTPIALSGARLTIEIAGSSDVVKVDDPRSGKVEHYATPDADGNYRVEVDPGIYSKVVGRIEFPFNGKNYRLDLHPENESARKRESSEGIVQDFTWRLSGLRPRMEQSSLQPIAYYGGAVRLDFRSYEKGAGDRVKPPPTGTTLQFKLAPQGKLADGSEGKELTFDRKYDSLFVGVDNDQLVDVPLGMYRLSGEEVYPDKSRRTLKILDVGGIWNTSTVGTFEPNLIDNRLHHVSARFTRSQ